MSNDLKLRVLFDAIDKLSGPLKRIAGSGHNTSKAIRATAAEIKRLESLQRGVTGFRKMESQLGDTSIKLMAARRELRRLGDAAASSDGTNKKLNAALRKQGEVVGKLIAQEERHRNALHATKRELETAGISTSRLAVHERRLQADIAKANQALDGQRKRLGKLNAAQQRMQRLQAAGKKMAIGGATAVAAGAVGARGLLAPVREFANQEDAAAQLRASMMGADGKVAKEFAQIDALAQRLGNRLPGTTTDFYEMMTMLRRQGMSAKVILGGLGEATGYLGVQLKMGYSDAAEFAAKLQDATRTTEGDMMSLSDVIQRTFYLGVDSNNMLQGYSKLTPSMDVLRKHGLEAAKIFAPLLVMADQAGMKGEQSGNALRKVFQGVMQNPAGLNKNLSDVGIKIKFNFTDGKGEFGGLDKMFSELQKLKQLSTQDRLVAIKEMFGNDAETLQVVSLLMSKGAAGYAEVQGKMQSQAGLQLRVNSQLGTLKNLWEAATGTFVNVLATVGSAIAPDLKKMVDGISRATERMQVWAKENPKLSGGLFKVAAGISAVLIGGGALAIVIGSALMPFAWLQMSLVKTEPLLRSVGSGIMRLSTRAIPMLTNSLRMLLPMLGGISLPVLAVVGAVALAGVLIWKYWKPIKAFLTGMWAGISAAAQPVLSMLGAALEPLKPAWDWLVGKVGEAWDWFTKLLAPVNSTSTELQNASDYGRAFGEMLGTVLLAPLNLVTAGADLLGTVLHKVFDWSPLGLIVNNWSAITTYLSGLWDRFKTIGGNLMDGLAQGITGGLAKVTETVQSVAGKAVSLFKNALGIRSPSRVFAQLGGYTMQGLALGLDRGQSLPMRALNAAASNLRGVGAGLALGAMTATPALAVDQRAPLAPRSTNVSAGATYNITIHAAAGSNPQDIAAEVRKVMEDIERQKAVRARSSLSDYGN